MWCTVLKSFKGLVGAIQLSCHSRGITHGREPLTEMETKRSLNNPTESHSSETAVQMKKLKHKLGHGEVTHLWI